MPVDAGKEAEIRALLAGGEHARALAILLETYGSELLGWLRAVTRDADEGDDVFAMLGEQLWQALPRFRHQSSARTFAYAVGRNCLGHHRRDPLRRRTVDVGSTTWGAFAASTRASLTQQRLDRLTLLRQSLDADDQSLLVLRVDRDLSWREIAEVWTEEHAVAQTPQDLDRRAAALRKRFERITKELRARARAEGLLD